jgi:ABC-type transporter Mla subunit MlaD
VATAVLAADPSFVVDFDNSKGLRAGDPVFSEGKQVGEVTDVGFGERDTVEIRLRIDGPERDRIKKSSTFVIHPAGAGKSASIEHYTIDPASGPAKPGTRFEGARSDAEAWLRRGRLTADDLSRSMSRGVEEFRRNLEQLQQSKEWAKFKDQLASLSAKLTATGGELTRLLNEQLPKLQQELDDLYDQYRRELEKKELERRQRTPIP